MKDPYDKVTFHGRTTDRRTAVMARLAEKHLGFDLLCYQGSYSTAVGASAGTHSGGGALDVWSSADEPFHIVRALRDVGFAAWYRKQLYASNGDLIWDTHIHAIDIGNKKLSAAARDQVRQYRAGLDGLAGAGDDPQDYRPKPIEGFPYREYMRKRALRDRISDIVHAIKERRRRKAKVLRKLKQVGNH